MVISSGVLHLTMEAQHLAFRFCLTKQLRLLFISWHLNLQPVRPVVRQVWQHQGPRPLQLLTLFMQFITQWSVRVDFLIPLLWLLPSAAPSALFLSVQSYFSRSGRWKGWRSSIRALETRYRPWHPIRLKKARYRARSPAFKFMPSRNCQRPQST